MLRSKKNMLKLLLSWSLCHLNANDCRIKGTNLNSSENIRSIYYFCLFYFNQGTKKEHYVMGIGNWSIDGIIKY